MKLQFLLAALTAVTASNAFAAGYEKSIMWGGKTGSVAGISTSYIEGADALYFNPAGLVAKAPGQDLSLNVSPVWSTFSGPYNNNNDIENSKTGLSTPLSLIYSNTINDQWAFGVGGFISGGSKVEYENVNFNVAPNPTSGPINTKTDLQIGELSAGVAWKPTTSWKFGVAYRYVMARAAFSFAQRAYNGANYLGVLNAELTDLKDQESALRFGVQWAPSETWHVGLTYRSEVPLKAAGNIGGNFYKNNANTTPPFPASGSIASASATANTMFPQAVTLGADHDFSDTWKGMAEAAWTNYARVDGISVMTTTTAAGSIPVNNAYLNQQWKDQWNFRLGGAYMGWSWPVRFGYGLTTQVTSSDWARPTFTPPGVSHTLTAGSGHTFELGSTKLDFNGAAEYTFVSGDGNGAAAGTPSGDIRAGTFKTNSVAVHLGLAYLY